MQQFLCCPFYRLLLEAFHLHLHVRLAAADPYLTEEDVVQNGLLAVAECDGIRSAGLTGNDLQAPCSLRVCLYLVFCTVP